MKTVPFGLICSICPFLWCKYSHHGLFQITNGLTTGLQNACPKTEQSALVSRYEPVLAADHWIQGLVVSKADGMEGCDSRGWRWGVGGMEILQE